MAPGDYIGNKGLAQEADPPSPAATERAIGVALVKSFTFLDFALTLRASRLYK